VALADVAGGAGGISELRIPGVTASAALRLPVDATRGVRGADLRSVGLSYLFERVTGDDPYHRDTTDGPRNVQRPGDAEQTMQRVFQVPAPRRFAATAWVQPFAQTPDDTLDRLAGYRGPVRATSSSRAAGEPRWRASMALDGDPRTAWIGDWTAGMPPWLAVERAAPVRVTVLRLRPADQPVRRPTRVRLLWPGGSTAPLAVSAAGLLRLPHPIRVRRLRIEVLDAVAPPDATAADERAVGVAEIDGLPQMRLPQRAGFSAPCGTVRVRVGAAMIALRVAGSARAFADGTPLPARSCGDPLALGAGVQRLEVQAGPLAVDDLRLYSPAPAPVAVAAGAGSVTHVGTAGRGSYSGVRVNVTAPSWIVLGEGYNRGWRASCNGRSLGAPTPIDGYANGWRVNPACRAVSFSFAPNRLALIGYIVSLIAAVACLVLILAGRGRRRPIGPLTAEVPGSDAPPRREPATRAIALAVPVGVAFGFVFGVVPGILSVPVIAFVLWRGIGAEAATVVAAALLGIVVPILYLALPGDEAGGNHFGYAMAHLGAHYVAVAALGLMMLALWRSLQSRRRAVAR
jgi:hypothetical protein